jgi:hypothetical protein
MNFRDPYYDPYAKTSASTTDTTNIAKHPYVARQRMKDDMSDAQKQGVATWNSLIDKLNEAGLMEPKP